MKKKYTSLTDAFLVVAILVFALGLFSGGWVIMTTRGGLISGLTIIFSALLAALLLAAVSAAIDLLASIEVNTRTTAAYFERRVEAANRGGVQPIERSKPGE